MNTGRTVFSQLIEPLPHREFQKCVARYRGSYYLKGFSCWDQFFSMALCPKTRSGPKVFFNRQSHLTFQAV